MSKAKAESAVSRTRRSRSDFQLPLFTDHVNLLGLCPHTEFFVQKRRTAEDPGGKDSIAHLAQRAQPKRAQAQSVNTRPTQ